MNDAKYKRTKKRLTKLVAKWKRRLRLEQWAIRTIFCRHSLAKSAGVSKSAVANCVADWRYLEAAVSFDMPSLAEMNREDLEQVVLHELVHVLVSEMREWQADNTSTEGAMDHEERVVTHITNVLWGMRA